MNETRLRVGVKILLQNENGQYLILKRSAEKYSDIKNLWDIPGGRIDPSTPLLENLEREVREETKLKITDQPVLIFAQDIIVPEKQKHTVRLTYTGKTTSEPILDKTENTEYKWLSLSELKDLDGLDNFVKEILDKKIIT